MPNKSFIIFRIFFLIQHTQNVINFVKKQQSPYIEEEVTSDLLFDIEPYWFCICYKFVHTNHPHRQLGYIWVLFGFNISSGKKNVQK